MTASTPRGCGFAAILPVIVIAISSRPAAHDTTPPVNGHLLLQDVAFGAEEAEQLPKPVPLLNDVDEWPLLDVPAPTSLRSSAFDRTPVGKTAYGVPGPSGEYRIDSMGDRLVLKVPSNWQRVSAGTAVIFAPEDAVHAGRDIVAATHGVRLTVARSVTGDLAGDIQALLRHFGKVNPQLRWAPAFQHSQIAGRRALGTTLSNVSPITGTFEEVWIAATHLADGSVLYVLGVAPQEDSGMYRGVFKRIVESIQVAR